MFDHLYLNLITRLSFLFFIVPFIIHTKGVMTQVVHFYSVMTSIWCPACISHPILLINASIFSHYYYYVWWNAGGCNDIIVRYGETSYYVRAVLFGKKYYCKKVINETLQVCELSSLMFPKNRCIRKIRIFRISLLLLW